MLSRLRRSASIWRVDKTGRVLAYVPKTSSPENVFLSHMKMPSSVLSLASASLYETEIEITQRFSSSLRDYIHLLYRDAQQHTFRPSHPIGVNYATHLALKFRKQA
jgi:hypothetical protein